MKNLKSKMANGRLKLGPDFPISTFQFPISNFQLAILLLLLLLGACNTNEATHEHETYTCPMHPSVVSDRPGTCPVCGMDLVRKARTGEAVEVTEDLSRLLKSPSQNVIASVTTIKAQYKSVPISVAAQGVVTYDTRNIYTIPARIGGRLEKVYLKYEFQRVAKGQKVAELYSPELITAQRELIFLLENDPDNQSLIIAARRKLELLGMTAGQINRVAERKEAGNTITVHSLHSGYLISGQQAPSATAATSQASPDGGGMNDGMGASGSTSVQRTQDSPNAVGVIVREGDYVTAGETLFTLVDANAVRIELNLPGNYSNIIKEGDSVKLDLGNGQAEMARVDFIQPFFGEGQEFMKVRVYTGRTENLHVGHLVNATIIVAPRESLWVPREAVLDLGTQKVVFLKDRGVLKPKEVTTGMTSEDLIEIKSGLASSEEVAANAQFLVDSESFIEIRK